MQFTDWSVQARTEFAIYHSSLDCPVRKLSYCPQRHVFFKKHSLKIPQRFYANILPVGNDYNSCIHFLLTTFASAILSCLT